MRRVLAVVLACVLCLNGFGVTGSAMDNTPADLAGHWAVNEISRLMDEGIVSGNVVDGKIQIRPNDNITRGEFLKLALYSRFTESEINGLLSGVEGAELSDISGYWGKNLIELAVELGVVNGYPDGSFQPNKSISRVEAVKVLMSLDHLVMNLKGEKSQGFSDVQSAFWGKPYIDQAQSLKLVGGYSDGTFKPNKAITRGEAMVIADRFINVSSLSNFLVNLAGMKVTVGKTEINNGETLSVSLDQDQLDSLYSGVRRTEGLTYQLEIRDDGEMVYVSDQNNEAAIEVEASFEGHLHVFLVPVIGGATQSEAAIELVGDEGVVVLLDDLIIVENDPIPAGNPTGGNTGSGNGGDDGSGVEEPTPLSLALDLGRFAYDEENARYIIDTMVDKLTGQVTSDEPQYTLSYVVSDKNGTSIDNGVLTASDVFTIDEPGISYGLNTLVINIDDGEQILSSTITFDSKSYANSVYMQVDEGDNDHDTLSNYYESLVGTDPDKDDSDDDGLMDNIEIWYWV